ncbi:hypothetical protein BASA81_010053 [Batrachochytrium salamandrivorans]|nr:hypothetical protein BASA81_010053 [Batrachochytrium salamandrivorans]
MSTKVDPEEGIVPIADVVPSHEQQPPALTTRASLDELFAAKATERKPFKCSKPDFHSRKAKALMCLGFVLVVIAILVGVLYPKIPIVVVDREATAKTIGVERNNGVPVRVFGNISVALDNANVMNIDVKEMQLSVLVGKQSFSQTTVSTMIGQLTIPGSSVSHHVIPVSIPIPDSVNLVALAADIASDCLRDNRMTLVVSGSAKLVALSINMDFKFGPMPVEAVCLE